MPSAISPSPISSGCWCPRVFVARFLRLTRLGMRGLSVRLVRRRAMRACFDAVSAFPLAPLLELLGGAALGAVHRLRGCALLPCRIQVGLSLGRAQPRERLLRLERVPGGAGALQLRHGARELGVLALQRRA